VTEAKAILKLNGGRGALLCNGCSTILSYGSDHNIETEHYCGECYRSADYIITKDRRVRDKTINRFELIDETGRVIVKYGVSVELLYQDDGRTLKVVLRDNES
jgi:hypothetical protein|tara:strand:- start:102 stop:410 length:309 start_codon:yes stop_codon:yes gene_type:complete